MRNYLITDPKIKMAKNVEIIDMPVIITINKFDEETTIALKEKISLLTQCYLSKKTCVMLHKGSRVK